MKAPIATTPAFVPDGYFLAEAQSLSRTLFAVRLLCKGIAPTIVGPLLNILQGFDGYFVANITHDCNFGNSHASGSLGLFFGEGVSPFFARHSLAALSSLFQGKNLAGIVDGTHRALVSGCHP